MAIASVGVLGTANSASAGTSLVITTSAALQVGNVGLVDIALDNHQATDGQTSEISSVVDSAGNTWTKLLEFCNGQGGAAAGATISVWRTVATVELASGGTITITLANTKTSKAAHAWEFTVGAGNSLRIATSGSTTLAEDGVDNLGAMTLSGLSSKEYLFVRAAAVEGRNDTWNTSTNYTIINAAQGDTGTAGTSMEVKGEFRILTGTGDTSNPGVLGATRDSAHVYMALEEYSLGPTTLTGAGAAAGVATVTGVGRSTNKGVGSSTGLATVAAVGKSTAKAAGSSAGVATASAVGQAVTPGVGLSAGIATAAAVANSTNKAAGLSAGIATATAVANATNKAAGSSAGTSTAAAVGEDASSGATIETGAGLSQGTSTAAAIARLIANAVGSSTGTCTVLAVGRDDAAPVATGALMNHRRKWRRSHAP